MLSSTSELPDHVLGCTQTATQVSKCLLTISIPIPLCYWRVIYAPHQRMVHMMKRTEPADPFHTHTSLQAPLSIPPILKKQNQTIHFGYGISKRKNIVEPKEWMALLGKEMPSFQEVLENRFRRRFPSKGSQWLLCHPGNQAMSSPTRSVHLSPGKGTLSWIPDPSPKGSSYYTVYDVKLLYIASTTPTCFWVLFTSH